MLQKNQRLNLKKDFKKVASGQKKETHSLKFFYLFLDNPQPLVGIANSKNYFKKAHDRNRARRLTSKAVETLYPSLNKNLNLVIMPKSQVLEKNLEQLIKEVESVKDLFEFN